MNEYLKEIAKMLECLHELTPISFTKKGQKMTVNHPKWEMVTTHTARRSFATNEYKAGTPTISIMAITGHKTEKSFLKYIKATPKEHAQILQLAWEQRKNTKIIQLTA
jgi:integrase